MYVISYSVWPKPQSTIAIIVLCWDDITAMPTPGYVFRDSGTTPPALNQPDPTQEYIPNPDFDSSSRKDIMEEIPTESHALAKADHEEKGIAQLNNGEGEVEDLGWNAHPKDIPSPLIGRLQNEELWTLVRRFNKQIYHVKYNPEAPMSGLDLYVAADDEFSPDKLRSNLERLYMTVIVGLAAFGKHIARLRSWKEPRRTGASCAAYFIAWIFDFIVPMIVATLICLTVYPPSRTLLFPPAPLALVSGRTGGVQKPKAGVLGSKDSITGAPEKHKGEAVEQEANNFVSSIANIAISSAARKHEEDPLNNATPDPTNLGSALAGAQGNAGGDNKSVRHDKTKEPMENAMWEKMRPAMHILCDICDTWERFANALSPTPPFPQQTARFKLSGILAPALLVSLMVTSYAFMKTITFSAGFGFFGDPIISRGLAWLNQEFPHWEKFLEIQNTILKEVPTNAQLTLTLLRIGEVNKAPIPPPPRSDSLSHSRPVSIYSEDLGTLDAPKEEVHDTIHKSEVSNDDQTQPEEPRKKKGSRILGLLKGTTKGVVQTKLSADRARAKLGSEHAKNHIGVLSNEKSPSGPVDFKARYRGKKGYAYISTATAVPYISFSYGGILTPDSSPPQQQQSKQSVFSIPVAEIQELKKVGGLGWKSKLVVGWATDKDVADGLEIVDRRDERWGLTAIPMREELFNRLVAMGGQKWESY
ncbi:MAG: hypothetical protein M1834_000700 [Cirrosporium novae-zelandiae]|nr:MAG: hypothetical protein M1834_000700 [Cirrosporium novae-zelandiae]